MTAYHCSIKTLKKSNKCKKIAMIKLNKNDQINTNKMNNTYILF